jgi:hypothetical protein
MSEGKGKGKGKGSTVVSKTITLHISKGYKPLVEAIDSLASKWDTERNPLVWTILTNYLSAPLDELERPYNLKSKRARLEARKVKLLAKLEAINKKL